MAHRIEIWIAAAAAVACTARARDGEDGIAALPEIAQIAEPGATAIVVRGALTKRRARRMTALALAVQRDVLRRFGTGKDTSGLPPVRLCLFESSESYQGFVKQEFGEDGNHSELGFYSPYRRIAVANLGRSVGNLRHELAHAVIGDDWPEIPDWINEGIGALYGTARRNNNGFRFLVNYRLRHLRAARKAGILPDLAALAASGRAEVYGDRSSAYYAAARYLLLYLDRRGELEAFIRDLRSEPPTAEHQLEVLERHVEYERFLKWTEKLRLGKPRVRSP